EQRKGCCVRLTSLDRLPDTNLALVILGEGPERGLLESMARELGVGSRVIMPGFLPNPWAWIARAAAFVLSSRWEGFASVLVEAMACGTPVVATDCAYGPSEILQDGVTGVLARVDHADSLAAGIHRVLTDPSLRDRLLTQGRI